MTMRVTMVEWVTTVRCRSLGLSHHLIVICFFFQKDDSGGSSSDEDELMKEAREEKEEKERKLAETRAKAAAKVATSQWALSRPHDNTFNIVTQASKGKKGKKATRGNSKGADPIDWSEFELKGREKSMPSDLTKKEKFAAKKKVSQTKIERRRKTDLINDAGREE